ncbi:MAG TPA: ATP-binding cassette domain-containing protein, partial [Bryobacteraceae bacterium]|nr:ATP-binding cassette domain-containing protein [Bryobacteraceae bacterium]
MSADIVFDKVTLNLGGRTILQSLTFQLMAGETVVLLGRSGSGKTSALRLINGLLRPTSGAILVAGKNVNDWDLLALRRRIGYVIQDVGLFPHMTVEQNISLLPRLEGWEASRIRTRVDELLQAVSLEPAVYRSRKPRELSGGQRQRVGIARALALDPDVLLWDEPFSALDPVIRRDLQDQFLELRASLGKTSVFVTHDVTEAMRLGTRIAVLADGKLDAFTTPQDLQQSPTTEAATLLRAAGLC